MLLTLTLTLTLTLAAGVAVAAGALATSPSSAASGAPASGVTGGSDCPADNPPNMLALVSGTPQTVQLDSSFAGPLQVTLANTDGCPLTTAVAGTTVTFSAPASGPSGVFAASGSASVTVGADASGSASAAMFTANDLAGSYTVTAGSSYGSIAFSLTNTAVGVSATIAPRAPASQLATVGAHYASPLSVQVLDANGNPVQGATVTFTLGAGGGGAGAGGGSAGSASPGASFDGGGAQASARTGSAGVATSPLFAANDVAGSFTASAATAGLSEPASFSLDNVAGPSPTVRLVPGGRSAPVATRYGAPLQVQLLDAAGNPVVGTAVTFSLGASGSGSGGSGGGGAGASVGAGASFLDGSTQATETTDAGGDATSPAFRANATPGVFTATIAVSGVLNPLVVTLHNLAGKPATIRLVGGAHRSATVGTRYLHTLEVEVVGANGKPVQDTTVTFALGSGAGAGSGAGGGGSAAGASFLDGSAQVTETTGGKGIAVSPHFTANATAGTYTATASVAGVRNPASFTLANLAPTIAPGARARRTATVGRRYHSPLEVTVVGVHGEPVQGATVTFTLGAAGGGASGASGASGSAGASFAGGSTQATATTGAAGRAISPAFTANTIAGDFTATASISGTTKLATFALHNLAAAPATVSAGAAAGEATPAGAGFLIPLAVTVKDRDGNPVDGELVTFSAPTSGASGLFATGHGQSATVQVQTNADGIAVAPPFVANQTAGGYVVTATAGGAAAAAFALVNEPAAGR